MAGWLPSLLPGPRRSRSTRSIASEWSIVAWLWQAFRQDLAEIVNGFPYADGRYQARALDDLPSADGAGYLAWRAHPKTGERAPIGFAVVTGLRGEVHSLAGFWVATAARRGGVGRRLARHALERHGGPWEIGFQHENRAAGTFWRAVADDVFGAGRWTEVRRETVPHAPADHIIVTG